MDTHREGNEDEINPETVDPGVPQPRSESEK